MVKKFLAMIFLICGFTLQSFAQSGSDSSSPQIGTVRVDANPDHVINSFDPDSALGSSIDVLSRYDINKVFTPHIIQESLSAGWGPLTYRNNTELRMAAWHWNAHGTWSDAAHQRGYFTGSTDLKEPIRYILAYALPHRGFASSGDRPMEVGSSRVDLQACKLEYSIVSPK